MISASDVPERHSAPTAPKADQPPRRVPVQTLMQGAAEVILVHRGVEYRLRVTANGKLILTK